MSESLDGMVRSVSEDQSVRASPDRSIDVLQFMGYSVHTIYVRNEWTWTLIAFSTPYLILNTVHLLAYELDWSRVSRWLVPRTYFLIFITSHNNSPPSSHRLHQQQAISKLNLSSRVSEWSWPDGFGLTIDSSELMSCYGPLLVGIPRGKRSLNRAWHFSFRDVPNPNSCCITDRPTIFLLRLKEPAGVEVLCGKIFEFLTRLYGKDRENAQMSWNVKYFDWNLLEFKLHFKMYLS